MDGHGKVSTNIDVPRIGHHSMIITAEEATATEISQ
jgi:hypothetical protein